MLVLDWAIVIAYCVAVTLIGISLKKKSEGGVEDYFLSGRKLPWWLAGTSLVATSFSADTPLFVTGLVRTHGIAGNWHWWFLILASVASVFFFARLWRRARIVSDMEFLELRYGPGAGVVLRGVKALFVGVVFNVYALGAWPVLGLTKMMSTVTDWSKAYTVLFCSGLALLYTASAGLWGVVVNDFIHFAVAMAGAIMLAGFAIHSMGGFVSFWEKIQTFPQTAFFPKHTPETFWSSPLIFFFSLVLIQWWARGIEGDGVAVQKLSACKDEKESFYAMLWFNIAHYALRPWGWVIVALVSMIALPEVTDASGIIDHEMAYPKMVVMLLPAGFKGLMIASFFAAYMSTVDSLLNWGSSYVVNDIYRRFIRRDASPSHYVWAGRIATVFLMACGALVALTTTSIVGAFYNVLLLFSGVGLVGVARWFWWRVTPWSEIAAMVASGTFTLLAPIIARTFGWPDVMPVHLAIIVVCSNIVWISVTLLTPAVAPEYLKTFYERVRPAGFGWKPVSEIANHVEASDPIKLSLVGWFFGVLLVAGTTIGLGKSLLGFWQHAALAVVVAVIGLLGVVATIRKMKWDR
jgi:solute:Na+ symporter, SSS family